MFKKILVIPIALVTAVFIACGGGDKAPGAGFPGAGEATKNTSTPATTTEVTVAESTPTPTAVPGPTITEEWATEQMIPFATSLLEALLDQRYNDVYDMLSTESKTLCPRTEYVANLVAMMMFAETFGGRELLEAALLEIEDGTYGETFNEVSAERITTVDEDGELTTSVLEDGQWRFVDDGTCMAMNWNEDD